jgi:hypothetical protein
MTDLEIVLLIAFSFMTMMFYRAQRRVVFLSCTLVAIGLKEAYVEVDEVEKTYTIKHLKTRK